MPGIPVRTEKAGYFLLKNRAKSVAIYALFWAFLLIQLVGLDRREYDDKAEFPREEVTGWHGWIWI